MLACVFTGKNEWVIEKVDDPTLKADEVLVKVRAVGFCGTYLHIFGGEYFSSFPLIAGHEFSGEIVEVGKDVLNFRPGDRVTVDPNIPCEQCRFCRVNKQIHCENLKVIGVTQNGAFAEYVAVPQKVVFRLPDVLDYQEGAMAEPLACVIYALRRINLGAGSRVLVFGAGPIGLLMIACLSICGAAKIVVVDISKAKLEIAQELGAEVILADGSEMEILCQLFPYGFDLVVDATGVPSVMEKALSMVEPDGTFLVFGVAPEGEKINVEPYEIFRRDLHILGSFALNKTMQYSINLLAEKRIPVKRFISASFPLRSFGDALREVVENPDHLKVQIEF